MPSAKPPGRPASPFTPLDFQLVLLRRMADHNPDLVAEARRELGVSITDMREANKRWQAMLRSPRPRAATSRYRSILGEPESVALRKIGDLECEALRWPVPLWPDLRFEVMLAPNGTVWNEWLVRAPAAAVPELRTLDDLTPWSCTVDEAVRVRGREGEAEAGGGRQPRIACSDPGAWASEQVIRLAGLDVQDQYFRNWAAG